ncbi:hypothetical protein VHARVF571_320039 [Vibrio harveyi]|nr:hypothetical protein VHARVF571_320039 [Vibrio harveyi]
MRTLPNTTILVVKNPNYKLFHKLVEYILCNCLRGHAKIDIQQTVPHLVRVFC